MEDDSDNNPIKHEYGKNVISDNIIKESNYDPLVKSIIQATEAHPLSLSTRGETIILQTEAMETPYQIKKDTAYKILSMDEFGIVSKKNKAGTSAVAAFGGLHMKRNYKKGKPMELGL